MAKKTRTPLRIPWERGRRRQEGRGRGRGSGERWASTGGVNEDPARTGFGSHGRRASTLSWGVITCNCARRLATRKSVITISEIQEEMNAPPGDTRSNRRLPGRLARGRVLCSLLSVRALYLPAYRPISFLLSRISIFFPLLCFLCSLEGFQPNAGHDE